jgi:hypothetical protein
MGSERVAQQPAVLRQCLRVGVRAELVQQPRRALDVREEKGDRAGRERWPHVAGDSTQALGSSAALDEEAHELASVDARGPGRTGADPGDLV